MTADARCPHDHRSLTGLVGARAPYRYRGTCGQIVRRLKFEHDPACGAFLARAMADVLRPWARTEGRRAVVVSVPLHPRKARARGLDQASMLAEGVARRLDLPYRVRVLARSRETAPQGDPRVTSRELNVRGAFMVRRARPVVGRTVVLVDDVMTSGHTARECARVLRAAGVARVLLLTAARS